MLIDMSYITQFLFEFLLFIWLCVVVYRLVQGSLLPFLYEQLSKILEKRKELRSKIRLLNASKLRIEEQIKEQDRKFLDIKEKVDYWKKKLKEESDKNDMLNKELLEKLKKKRLEQSSNFADFKLRVRVVPAAINSAYKEIWKMYRDEKGRRLLEELIDKISSDPFKVKG